MLCNEFRDLMFERLSGELTPEQEQATLLHEESCPACRAELKHYGRLVNELRAGWPSEDAPPLGLTLPQAHNPGRAWYDTAGLWLARSSAALVAACLLFAVLVRPTVELDRSGLRVAFAHAAEPAAPAPVAPAALTEAQVKALVQTAVEEQLARRGGVQLAAQRQPASDPALALELWRLQQSQAGLWQQTQQNRSEERRVGKECRL